LAVSLTCNVHGLTCIRVDLRVNEFCLDAEPGNPSKLISHSSAVVDRTIKRFAAEVNRIKSHPVSALWLRDRQSRRDGPCSTEIKSKSIWQNQQLMAAGDVFHWLGN